MKKVIVKTLTRDKESDKEVIKVLKGILGSKMEIECLNMAPSFSKRGKLRLVYREF